MDNHPFATSLITIPTDVLENLILSQLDASSLVSCSLVCAHLGKISLRVFTRQKYGRKDVLRCIFSSGFLSLFLSFQKILLYPSVNHLRIHSQLLILAVQGTIAEF